MDVVLLIAVLLTTALSLYSVANGKVKVSGAFDVISLCLIVAIAYQFEKMNTILLVLLVIAIVLVALYLFLHKPKKKSADKKITYGGE